MPILPHALPTAGPFQLGDWNGREFVVTHRRWFPAILCWVLASVVSLWVLAGVLFPASDLVPEPDHFPILLSIAAALAICGIAIALWCRTFAITTKAISSRNGFPGWMRSTTFEGDTYIQVHPLSTTLRAKLVADWSGFAVVIHTSSETGAIIAAFTSQEDAEIHAKNIAATMRIEASAHPGAPLTCAA